MPPVRPKGWDPIEELRALAQLKEKQRLAAALKKEICPSDDEPHEDIWREKETYFYQFGKEVSVLKSPKPETVSMPNFVSPKQA